MERSQIEAFWRHHKEVWTKSGATEMTDLGSGMKVIELMTVGRKSRRERSALLTSLQREDGWLIAASNLGSDNHPGWWLNLDAAAGRAKIRVAGGEVVDVNAVVLEGTEREREWERLCASSPNYREYETATKRQIPIIHLRRAS